MIPKVGDRIELVSMGEDPDPITPGTRGTVAFIGGWLGGQTQVGVAWDNGRGLMLLLPLDRIRVLS